LKQPPKIPKIDSAAFESVPFQYARDVRDGKIVTGKKIKLAVDRFFSWVDNHEKKGYALDHLNGLHVIDFFADFLTHTKGSKSNEAFKLSPYQQFTLYNIFGWKKLNSKNKWVRVIRTVYQKVARKNGKSAELAGVGLYCQSCDNEPGAEIYVGATKELQAKILWEQAHQFVFKSQKLRRIGFKNTQREIRFSNRDSAGNYNSGVFRFLGGDSKTLDGLNPSVAIIDEYHAHPTDAVREVLESAMGAREQPLLYMITTAGFNTSSVCKQYEDVCVEILNGEKKDDSTFIMIHDLDDGDDYEKPENWAKPNPNLGVSVKLSYIADELKKAKNQPSKLPNFLTKICNRWVDGNSTWIPAEKWDNCKVKEIPISAFVENGSFAGMDLATTTDIAALVFLSNPDANGDRFLKPYFFAPAENIILRSKRDAVPYVAWRDAGYLIATPGDTIDYDYIKDIAKKSYYDLKTERIEVDEWNATQIVNDLINDGLNMSFFGQGIGNISNPTKQFERLVYQGKIKHDGNPILKWMLSGCKIYRDPNENIKIHKGQSNSGIKRVDGIIAAIMALGGSQSPGENKESQYNEADADYTI
tara:strand:- start:14928 stop:16685 length:1758 start_codon:yes stop_codon:yes gene_type:complete